MTKTVAEYIDTLPAALSLRGAAGASSADVIARIRQECTGAIKAGVLPAGTKLSVRKRPGGYTRSITVEIVTWGGAVFSDEYAEQCMEAFAKGADQPAWTGRGRPLTDTLAHALRALELIAGRHNYNNSDIQTDYFDVGYYLHVEAGKVEAAAMTGMRAELDPKFADLRNRAIEAAKALGPAVVKSLVGSDGIEVVGQYALERVLRAAERSQGRPLAFDKRRGWQVAA
jgi:hypothetical protein